MIMVILSTVAMAQNTGSFKYSYEDSNNELYKQYAQLLEQRGFFENISKGLNASVALPYDIGLVAVQCDTPNAFWSPDNKAIVVCYEMLEFLVSVFRRQISNETELSNAVFGALEFIFYHELGHALIDVFEIPATGREEDAVDQFSTLFLLDTDVGIAAALSGASFFYELGANRTGSVQDLAFWDEHSLDQQRFYNIVCLIYGSNPNRYQNLVVQNSKGFLPGNGTGFLPKERAVRCPSEYKDINRSWNILINNYVSFHENNNQGQASVNSVPTNPNPVAAPNPVTTASNSRSEKYQYESYVGNLSSNDSQLDSGEYYDTYEVELKAGQELNVVLQSNDFDTYLIVMTPEKLSFENDDAEESQARYASALTMPVIVSGTYKIAATSYEKAQQGSYQLLIAKQDGIYDGLSEEALQAGDLQFNSGEYYDLYSYEFQANTHITLALSSSEFDPYIVVESPSGKRLENDDYAGQSHLSRLDFDVQEGGTWKVYVSSYDEGESGAYQLVIGHGGQVQTANQPTASSTAIEQHNGRLDATDSTLDTGEYVDIYKVELSKGQRAVFVLSSSQFHTYLGVKAPTGTVYESDELANDIAHSQISIVADEAGEWQIFVTSFSVGEIGSYQLSIEK